MRFPKPPQLMKPEELSNFVRRLIQERQPESDALDYKKLANTGTQKDRLELAKDISSFANELGGSVIYGVPEVEEDGVPIPVPLERCGMDINSGMPERIENLLLDGIQPVLPNLFIKLVRLNEIEPKGLLVVHHPASWDKPHMVESYNERRFYRRGNYRTVRMTEREVEAAYASRRAVQASAEEFFRTADLGTVPISGRFFRVIIYPRFTLIRRDEMREDRFRSWLNDNPPAGRQGSWRPFLDGVCFLSYAPGGLNDREFELRLFHNGALSLTMDMEHLLVDSRLELARTVKVLDDYGLGPACKAHELLGVAGPLTLKIIILHAMELEAGFKSEGAISLDLGPSSLDRDLVAFVEESSTEELLGQRERLCSRISDRLMSAFGMWRR